MNLVPRKKSAFEIGENRVLLMICLKGTPVLGHAAFFGAKFSADFCGNGLGDDFLDVFRLWKKILKAQFVSFQHIVLGPR